MFWKNQQKLSDKQVSEKINDVLTPSGIHEKDIAKCIEEQENRLRSFLMEEANYLRSQEVACRVPGEAFNRATVLSQLSIFLTGVYIPNKYTVVHGTTGKQLIARRPTQVSNVCTTNRIKSAE